MGVDFSCFLYIFFYIPVYEVRELKIELTHGYIYTKETHNQFVNNKLEQKV